MKRFKLFVDIHKEEVWLNEQLKQGYELVRVSGVGKYYFKKITNTNQVIRVACRSLKKGELISYIKTYTDLGWKRVPNSQYHPIHYWIKEKDGHDDLCQDITLLSNEMLEKITSSYLPIFSLLVAIFPLLLAQGKIFYLNPKGAYFTPDLWEKEDGQFILSFLFETPFALGRFAFPWLLIIMLVFFVLKIGFFTVKCRRIKK
ncbi:DUF2812 domain-containing protein [Baia soyae]|uniref:Uncharacterized protein DUF2812 n=1 Tax=Baia soyae TaxID=1544746 RepID=A0A4R2S1W1_9BACL|nr:DUF2812 domain-containing protein [Baia soyae]TCP70215.1 uncharacterized protein DUF2812 [Baia soyae]